MTAVLRKCKILAARLKSAEFAKWVDWELDGYPKDQPLPEYRQLTITYFANFVSSGWRVPRAAVPIQVVPEKFRDGFRHIEFRDGIAKVASFARATGTLAVERPELIFALQGKMYPEMECHRVWGETSPTEFEQVLSALTSRMLDFCLKLEVRTRRLVRLRRIPNLYHAKSSPLLCRMCFTGPSVISPRTAKTSLRMHRWFPRTSFFGSLLSLQIT